MTAEIEIIRRFVDFAKDSNRNAAKKILDDLQKHIANSEIRKTSKYAEPIMEIQRILVSITNGRAVDMKQTKFEQLEKLLKPTVKPTRKINAVSEPAKLRQGLGNIDNPDMARMFRRSLQQYVDNYVPAPPQPKYVAESAPINLDGVETPKKHRLSKSDQMNSVDFMNEKFDCIKLTGRWRKLIGLPQSDAKIMFYGRPGNGKSTLAIQFAAYVSRTLGYKTLYVTSEEAFSYTFQEKLQRLKAANPNLTITGEFPYDVSKYKFIFIDSVNHSRMSPEDVNNLPEGKFYVYVFQTTKGGQFRGSQEYLHDVDAEIRVENMQAQAGKNRFGGYEKIDVLPPRKEDNNAAK